MNVVPRPARELMTAMRDADLVGARRIYYEQILPLVEVMMRNHNPTGTIGAGVTRARRATEARPRRQ